jgi:hypothetical protein
VECYKKQWERCGFNVAATVELLREWAYDLYWLAGAFIRSSADALLPESCDLLRVPKRDAVLVG